MNGDGMADLVGFGDAGVYVALATGGGNFADPLLVFGNLGRGGQAGGWANNDVYRDRDGSRRQHHLEVFALGG